MRGEPQSSRSVACRYDEYALDVLSFVSQLCTTLTLLFALSEKTNLLEDGIVSPGTLNGILMCVQIAPVVAGIGVLGYAVHRKMNARKEGKRMAALAPGFLAASNAVKPNQQKSGATSSNKPAFAFATPLAVKSSSQVELLSSGQAPTDTHLTSSGSGNDVMPGSSSIEVKVEVVT